MPVLVYQSQKWYFLCRFSGKWVDMSIKSDKNFENLIVFCLKCFRMIENDKKTVFKCSILPKFI